MGVHKGLTLDNNIFCDIIRAIDKLEQIDIDTNYGTSTFDTWCLHATPRHEIKFTFRDCAKYSDIAGALHKTADALTPEEERFPEVERVIYSGPATVAIFKDGTKVVTKCHDGDDFDPMVGLINCCIRKLTRNHGHAIDAWDGVPKLIADSLGGPDDFAFMSDVLAMVANAITDEGNYKAVLDRVAHELADEEYHDGLSRISDAMIETAKDKGWDHDAMRQEIRRLIDEGEL